jgi:hypothetical protein
MPWMPLVCILQSGGDDQLQKSIRYNSIKHYNVVLPFHMKALTCSG